MPTVVSFMDTGTDDRLSEELLNTLRDALVDRYALERELGRGGMATVFLAQDVKHRRKVAIKVLHPDIAAAIGPERFLREIEIAAQLQHPHILPLYDSGAVGSHLFYVMPFVEGESLRDRLEREKQLSQEEVIKITSEIASALGYAHSRGIVHRDIKPENVMLSAGTVVVADFGIARAASAAEQQQLTQTGTVIGTPAYMSPEQGTGSDIDGRSDQYSLACVVYEMLVGQPPFTGPNVQAVIARHSIDMVSPPSIVRDTIPDAMENALLRALAKVPADRFPTVIMFAEALAKPSTVTAAMRRRSTVTQGIGRPSVTLQLPVPGWRPLLRWGVPVLVLLVAGWLTRGAWLGRRVAAEGGRPAPNRIAVLYFEDRSADKSLGYMADGLTEALIHELSAVTALQVISRHGVSPYRHASVGTDSIARALNVGTIVDGTLAQASDSLRLSVSMVDAASGDEIEATTLKVPRADPLALMETLANQVALFLRHRLGQELRQLSARAETRNADAWELVQKAKALSLNLDSLLAAGGTAAAGALAQADSLLVQAAAKDRKWTGPILERGWLAWEERRVTGFDKGPAEQWSGRGLDFADEALRLKPDDPEALHLRGTMRYIRWVLNLDPAPLTASQLLDAAERDLRAGAVAGNRNRASALALLSHLLLRKSETVDGKLAAMEAYEVDPYLTEAPDVLARLFASSLDLEDAAEAKKWCQEAFRRFPRDPSFTECQISLYALKGQKPDVANLWRLLDQNVALYPPNDRDFRRRRGALLVAMGIANAGFGDSARAVARRARAGPDVDPTRDLIYVEILLRNLLGDRDESLQLLKLYLVTNPQDKATIASDSTWWWRDLRADPEFKRLVSK